jgi:predicted GIY-YIG superfamily endonuclease
MACFRCGRRGHFSADCYASTAVKNAPITCFRCGRDGHLSTECYASTSVKKEPITCFRCGRDGHLSTECYASTAVKPQANKRARVASPRTRSGVYVLRYPDGHVYVGKSLDIDARIRQHNAGQVGCTSTRRGAPREVPTLTPRTGDDLEAWERNETLAQMRAHGIEKVRGWMYTAQALTQEMEDSIEAQLCEKYDLCRRCGQPGHFAAQCVREEQEAGSSEDDEASSDGEAWSANSDADDYSD